MPIETRTEEVDSQIDGGLTNSLNPNYGGTEVHFIWPGYTKTFEAHTPNSSKDKQEWKNYQHYKRSVIIPQPAVSVTGSVNVHAEEYPHWYDTFSSKHPFAWSCSEFGAPGDPTDGLEEWFNSDGVGFTPDPSGLNGLKQASLNSMLPLIKGELSLINSIIELKDFKSLPKTIKKMKELAETTLYGLSVGGRPTLRRYLNASADGYLQTQFNILPLLSDISGIYTAVTKIRARISKLVSEQGQSQTRHYRRDLGTSGPQISEQTFASPAPLGANAYACNYSCGVVSEAKRYVYTDKSVFHAEVQYNYNYTAYQVEHAQLLGLLDAFGVNLNPAIIWNAIPWTFVIDWVLGVSRWLDNRKLLNMEPVINIYRYLWSITRQRRVLVYRDVRFTTKYHDIGPSDFGMNPSHQMPGCFESSYKRVVETPSVGSIVSSGLSLKEFSLGAALIVSGTHHKRNRTR